MLLYLSKHRAEEVSCEARAPDCVPMEVEPGNRTWNQPDPLLFKGSVQEVKQAESKLIQSNSLEVHILFFPRPDRVEHKPVLSAMRWLTTAPVRSIPAEQ